MSSPSANVLLIFIKNPIKGTVKTRLAATVGDARALEIYQKLLAYTRRVVQKVQVDRQVWYSRFVDENDAWDADLFIPRRQQGASLGQRMKHAFEQAFNDGCPKAVIIGSDCAELQPHHIKQAYDALDRNDVVIGPSEDGGYYLLGMNRFLPVLFEDKSWSTEEVFQQTLTDCKSHNLRYHMLETLNDVDTEADWQRVRDRFER